MSRSNRIGVYVGLALVIAGYIIALVAVGRIVHGHLHKQHTVSERGSVDVSPDIDRPSALTIEGSYDEQGSDQMGGVDTVARQWGVVPKTSDVGDSGISTDGQGNGDARQRPRNGRPRSQSKYTAALDYFWSRESSKGTDPGWKIPGPAGEEGEYRVTPIFIAEVKRLSGYVIDPFDNESCRYGITIWLDYWAPRVFPKGYTIGELYEMYRRGPKGYREWLERKAAGQ